MVSSVFLGMPTPSPEQFLHQVDRIGASFGINVSPVFDLAHLQTLSPGTFGRELADHFAHHQFPPLTSGPRRKQLHDLVHVITGYGVDPIGELEVQAFMLGSKFFPMHILLGIALFDLTDRQRQTLQLDRRTIFRRVWQAYQRGQQSGFDIDTWQPEQQWHLPLIQVQQTFHLSN
jgi:ubiquinone biosynthesis protein COQ4